MNRREMIKAWAVLLTEDSVKTLLVELVADAMDGEMVSFSDESGVPYWSNTGDPLVEGQVPYPED